MFRAKQKILCAKEEETYGSDITPAVGTNDIDASNIVINYRGEKLDRDLQRESLSPENPVIGKKSIEISFTCELKGSGSAGTAPQIADLLEACGFSESVDAGSSVVYAPASTGHKSVTIYLYDVQVESSGNYRLHKITGARGNANLIFEAGQIARVEFTFQGLYNIPTDVVDPGDPSYESTNPPIVDSATLQLNSESLIAQMVGINLNNNVVEREDLNTAHGLKGFEITGRAPTGEMNPEAVLLATYDFWTDWADATARALELTLGATAGNILEVSAPKVTPDNIDEADRNGIRAERIPFTLGLDSGDDELILTFK